MSNPECSENLRYKGRFITRKQLGRRISQQVAGKTSKRKNTDDNPTGRHKRRKWAEEEEDDAPGVVGHRIVDLNLLGDELECKVCNKTLSLKNIERELPRGLGSYLYIKCIDCLLVKRVAITKCLKPREDKEKQYFEINLKAAVGCIHAGIGNQALNKILTCLGMPMLSSNTHKFYEEMTGPVIQTIAKESCDKAAKIERELTIKNKEKIEKMVPSDVRQNFIIPSEESPMPSEANTEELSSDEESTEELSLDEENTEPGIGASPESAAPSESSSAEWSQPDETIKKPSARWKNYPCAATADMAFIVRVMLSFDTAWSKRGNGKNYDSLNGYASFSGTQSGLIIDYGTENRVCRKCLSGNPKSNHRCVQKYTGSAKAIEACLAVKLATKSDILMKNNLELGIFCGDEDSSAIAKIRAASKHPVVKLSDRNHLARGIKKLFYDIPKAKDPEGEINKISIEYLDKCFNYAMAQNHGDEEGLSAALRSIPGHAFNKHENCGDWCGYSKNPEDYSHRTIGEGLQSPVLFVELERIFNKLADNAGKYAHTASSQCNESLNAAIARKAPKANCYSLSESMDFRVAAAVAEKNEGQEYIIQIFERLQLSVDVNLRKYIDYTEEIAIRKANTACTRESKADRIEKRKKRNALKYKNEKSEGPTYCSRMALLNTPTINQPMHPSENDETVDMANDNYQVIFFDLETSGLGASCDILQIAASTGLRQFNMYVKPSKPIDARATEVHGLTNVSGDLYLHGVPVQSSNLRDVLIKFIAYLEEFGKLCILVAHNLSFDGPRLLRAIKRLSLLNEFESTVAGFSCSLQGYRMKHKGKKFMKNDLSLSVLAHPFINVNESDTHNASYDVYMLRYFAFNVFTVDDFLSQIITVPNAIEKYDANKKVKELLNSLSPLSKIIPNSLRQKMSKSGIGIEELRKAFDSDEKSGVIQLLTAEMKYKPRSIDLDTICERIIEQLRNEPRNKSD